MVTVHRVKKIVDSQAVEKLQTIQSGKNWPVETIESDILEFE